MVSLGTKKFGLTIGAIVYTAIWIIILIFATLIFFIGFPLSSIILTPITWIVMGLMIYATTSTVHRTWLMLLFSALFGPFAPLYLLSETFARMELYEKIKAEIKNKKNNSDIDEKRET